MKLHELYEAKPSKKKVSESKLYNAAMKLCESMISALETISQGPKLRKGMEGASHLYITNPFTSSAITELFSTHPPLHKRVQNINKIKF